MISLQKSFSPEIEHDYRLRLMPVLVFGLRLVALSFLLSKPNTYQDGNMGLVEQLLRRAPWFFVQDLQKIYSAIPISVVAAELQQSPERTHDYLEDLIKRRLLNAAIEYPQSGQPLLRFYTNLSSGPLAKSEQQHLSAILSQKARIERLSEQVKIVDARMSVTRYWVDHLKKRSQKPDDSLDREPSDQMPWTGSRDADGDEDLMESMDIA